MKIKKNYVLLACVTGLIVLCIIGYSCIKTSKQNNVNPISKLVQYNDKITSITILNGLTGKINEVSDENTMNLVKNYISSLETNSKKVDEATGFEYSLTLYDSKNSVGSIVFINPNLIKVDGNYYNIVNSNNFDLKSLVP